jgi:cystathionine beta-lyase
MKTTKAGINTLCTHFGELEDHQFKGVVSPLYMSTSYAYDDVPVKRYPRYFNSPNQEALGKKIAALEHTESALIFSSGMAATSTAIMAFLQQGDHLVISRQTYGGTQNLLQEEFGKFGIEFTFVEGTDVSDYEAAIKSNTKLLFLETPSNPLLYLTDLKEVSAMAKAHNLITLIDNTFASPVNQNPADFGIDVIIHSATKYMGGHSDISAGAVAASQEHIHKIFHLAKNLGGNLSEYTVWLLERSLKTMGLRVKAQSENALKLAEYLKAHPAISNVYYPGLESHPGHEIAQSQMRGFGGMLSFEPVAEVSLKEFQDALNWIRPSMSLAGVESTLTVPAQTSHALLSADQRKEAGISDSLIRFSAGIEEFEDLRDDLNHALQSALKA